MTITRGTPSALHVALHVRDLAASTAFYSDLFGQGPAKQHPDYVKFELSDPPLVLSLNPGAPRVTRPRLSHLGMRVASHRELERLHERLEALGHDLRVERDTACCYARAHKVWALDPDGNAWELYELLADHEVHGHSAAACCATESSSCDG